LEKTEKTFKDRSSEEKTSPFLKDAKRLSFRRGGRGEAVKRTLTSDNSLGSLKGKFF